MNSVLGAGFGLYGHVPALIELGREVSIPARYRALFEARGELTQYASSVQFVEDEEALLRDASLVVLAKRPIDNDLLARNAARAGRKPRLVVEKPFSSTPAAARDLSDHLRQAGVSYATPYLLLHCDWARDLKARVAATDAGRIDLDWKFHSPSVATNWKSADALGGGALNYYFIHLIALAGYLFGSYELRDWWRERDADGDRVGMVVDHGGHVMHAAFSSDPWVSAFELKFDGVVMASAVTPFGPAPRRGERDPRIDILKRFYTEEVLAPEPLHLLSEEVLLDAWDRIGGAGAPRP